MKFLAIDTSGKHLTVLAYLDGRVEKSYLPDCALSHSVRLMDEIDGVCSHAGVTPREFDFFAVVVGAGSFTGIRIGIATVKGLCFACDKRALAVTSFDTIAYAEKSGVLNAVVDAGHDFVYLASYNEARALTRVPAYLSAKEALCFEGTFACAEKTCIDCKQVDPSEGLLNAVLAKQEELIGAEELVALYIRKSSAEESRCIVNGSLPT